MSSYFILSIKSLKRFALPLFSLTISLSTYAVDITPESMVGTGSCTATGNDTACWQAAINAAHDATTNKFGNVAGSSGKQYLINDTIIVCNGTEGVIDGHGAQLHWMGATGKPMFLIVGSNHMRFTNLMVHSTPSQPLESAFEFASTVTSPYTSPICQGPTWPSSKNSLDHVTAEGTNANGLNYGVRFSNRYNINNSDGINNDMSTIIDSTFYNVMKAVVLVEHSQSHQHRLISVNGYGAAGNTGCFVDSKTGFISSTGGFQNNWGNANFCVGGPYGTFDINESNSENSNRMLLVGNPGDTAGGSTNGAPVTVNINGGRFAANAVNADGRYISFNHVGELAVRGLHVDGIPPAAVISGKRLAIAVQPGIVQVGTTSVGGTTTAIVEGVSYYLNNGSAELPADKWTTFTYKAPAVLNGVTVTPVKIRDFGNVCVNGDASVAHGTGMAVPCKAAVATTTDL